MDHSLRPLRGRTLAGIAGLLTCLALAGAAPATAAGPVASSKPAQPNGHHGGGAAACRLGDNGQVKHVIYIQFDNTHLRRDMRQRAVGPRSRCRTCSTSCRTTARCWSNDHTVLISHTAGGILSSLTGVYPTATARRSRTATCARRRTGAFTFPSSFGYWTDPVSATQHADRPEHGRRRRAPTRRRRGSRTPAPAATSARSRRPTPCSRTPAPARTATSPRSSATGRRRRPRRSPRQRRRRGSAATRQGPDRLRRLRRPLRPGLGDLRQRPDRPAARRARRLHRLQGPVRRPGDRSAADRPAGVDAGHRPRSATRSSTRSASPASPASTACRPRSRSPTWRTMQEQPACRSRTRTSRTRTTSTASAGNAHTAFGPGSAGYVAQLRPTTTPSPPSSRGSPRDGINKSNTLFVFTVDEGDHFVGGTPTPGQLRRRQHARATGPARSARSTPTSTRWSSHQFPALARQFLGAGAPNAFTVHGDDAPPFYLAKARATAARSRQTDPLDARRSSATSPSSPPSTRTPAAPTICMVAMADQAEMKILHMFTTGDPARNATLRVLRRPELLPDRLPAAAPARRASTRPSPGTTATSSRRSPTPGSASSVRASPALGRTHRSGPTTPTCGRPCWL